MLKAIKQGFKKLIPGQPQSTQQPAQPRMAQRTAAANAGARQKSAISSGLPDSYLDIDSMFK